MPVSAVDSTSTMTSAASSISIQDFLKVLLTQLTYQDPLKPMDNQQFMAQVAQFTTLGQTQEMNANIGRLVANQAALQSVGLIGRTVQLSMDDGDVTGTVAALTFAGGAPQLAVQMTDGTVISNVDLSRIAAVR